MKVLKVLSSLLVVVFLLTSCNNKHGYEFWELSKFNMVAGALENNEEIKLLYSSRGPDYNNDRKYYIHLVVVSQKTGDTVNVLTVNLNHFEGNVEEQVFNFYDTNSFAGRSSFLEVEELQKLDKSRDIMKIPLPKIDKVARDPEFDEIADNRYPTVIGGIGKTTNPGQSTDEINLPEVD